MLWWPILYLNLLIFRTTWCFSTTTSRTRRHMKCSVWRDTRARRRRYATTSTALRSYLLPWNDGTLSWCSPTKTNILTTGKIDLKEFFYSSICCCVVRSCERLTNEQKTCIVVPCKHMSSHFFNAIEKSFVEFANLSVFFYWRDLKFTLLLHWIPYEVYSCGAEITHFCNKIPYFCSTKVLPAIIII